MSLYEKWLELANPFMPLSAVQKYWTEIETNYTASNRAYHNLNHIAELLGWAERFRTKITDYTSLCFAIWYHDIVYSVNSKNNEIESAKLAIFHLKNTNLPIPQLEKITTWIEATKTHQNSNNNKDLDFFLDFDLAILGSPLEQYLSYTQQIRKEYSIYPDLVYQLGRKKILKNMLRKSSIYQTPELYLQLEKQARKNIEQEIG